MKYHMTSAPLFGVPETPIEESLRSTAVYEDMHRPH